MPESIEIELYAHDGRWGIAPHPSRSNATIVNRGRYYPFKLFHKTVEFGDVPIRQFWMDHAGLYGSRAKPTRHSQLIPEYFWAMCRMGGSCHDPGPRESYILARLLPHTREKGARRVLHDAVLTSPTRTGTTKAGLVARLNERLAESRHQTLDMLSFQRRSGAFLGQLIFPGEVVREYERLTSELLDEVRASGAPWDYPDTSRHVEIFQDWMRTIGRRGGKECTKLALDMLSYECRAAFHRCYTVVWLQLLTELVSKHGLDDASALYHRLMHTDLVFPSDDARSFFHLFHGHIFALHPALSVFLQTTVGGELLGDFLRAGDDGPFRRLLHGFLIAIAEYQERSELIATDRRGKRVVVAVKDIEKKEAEQTQNRRRRGRSPGSSGNKFQGPKDRFPMKAAPNRR
ncbi:MAG: hypothetical protein JNK76_26825 [Planctomycetales bacterium]|nr:hypothetical protein [Planctomycetales bacterium]